MVFLFFLRTAQRYAQHGEPPNDTFTNEMETALSANKYRGIVYMLIAAAGFSIMGGFAKMLKGSFHTQELVFYRNFTGLLVLLFSFSRFPLKQTGGKIGLLLFRGLMGTIALYTLLFNILHIPLGTAMTYNTTNTLFIALLSYVVLKEKLGWKAIACILAGFAGVLLIYRPGGGIGLFFHLTGLTCGLTSALAYLSVSSLNRYYDTRIIVLSFLLTGILLPVIGVLLYAVGAGQNDFFIGPIRLPKNTEWITVSGMGLFALLGQYFVTKAYAHDKAGIVSAIGYSNIVFAILIGMLLGDHLPDLVAIAGIILVIVSGILVTLTRK
jgi:drug/metabolite transporter (DMT)-like permease